MQQYIAVGTERMFIEPSASTTIPRVTAMIAATAVATQLSTIIQYNTIQYNVQWWPEGGGWRRRVKVDSEQVSLESFSGESERLCGPKNGRELVPPLRSQNREKL